MCSTGNHNTNDDYCCFRSKELVCFALAVIMECAFCSEEKYSKLSITDGRMEWSADHRYPSDGIKGCSRRYILASFS